MNLYDMFFDTERRTAAVIGGGGKTTILAGIARDAVKLNRPLVLSTSTKLQRPCPRAALGYDAGSGAAFQSLAEVRGIGYQSFFARCFNK